MSLRHTSRPTPRPIPSLASRRPRRRAEAGFTLIEVLVPWH